MEPVRKIVLMLIVRMREAARVRKLGRVAPTHYSQEQQFAYFEGRRDEAAKACELARQIYKLSRARSPLVEHERRRVISISTKREEFITLDDGYVAYWPHGSVHGALSSWHLRVLADEVDRRNQAWDSHVQRNLPKRSPPKK